MLSILTSDLHLSFHVYFFPTEILYPFKQSYINHSDFLLTKGNSRQKWHESWKCNAVLLLTASPLNKINLSYFDKTMLHFGSKCYLEENEVFQL